MFKKLRLKLTLTNVAVVAVILIIFAAGIFVFMLRTTSIQTNQLINVISFNEGLADPRASTTVKKRHNQKLRYFYVKLDNQNKVVDTSSDFSAEKLNKLISKVLKTPDKDGYMDYDADEVYRYHIGKLKDGSGSYIVFIYNNANYDVMRSLLFVLLFTGIGGLSLAFLGSLFMADRALVPIKKSWQRQKNFVADASHELRTPLTVIETTTDLIMSRGDQTIDSQIKWLENIQAENKVMTKLVNDMLFLARADSDQNLPEKKEFQLHYALLEAYIPFEAPAIQQGIQLKPFEGDAVSIYGNESRIKQLVAILIDNAIKHTPSGGYIQMTLHDKGHNVEIAVSDTGEGISDEHINKIFERFYRVDKARSRSNGSSGLGLSIAEYIVSEHRGEIKVASVVGSGTNFRVILPK
jgi:signal transduction histidine kinase